MRHLCTITADLSHYASTLRVQEGIDGNKYRKMILKIIVKFGGTKLRAKLQWKEEVSSLLPDCKSSELGFMQGKICEGPVNVLAGSIL